MQLCPCVLVYIFFALCALLYSFALHVLYVENRAARDILNRTVFSIGVAEYSWWPVSHFIMYMAIGFVCAEHAVPMLLIGIGWELIEMLLNVLMYKKHGIKPPGSQYSENWWAGSWTDVLFNAAGFFVGALISTLKYRYA
jgi:hypothetical protein